MRVISVNVGLPRTVQWKGKAVSTCIFKAPVSGRIHLRTLNFDGDRQADLSVHGGPDKAVYVYPVEHYAYWHRELPDMTLPWGMFGENLTIEGLQEDTLQIGDRFRIDTAATSAARPVPRKRKSIRGLAMSRKCQEPTLQGKVMHWVRHDVN